jgi:hypothetical protein
LTCKERSLHITVLLLGLLVAGPIRSAFAPGRVQPKSQMRPRAEAEAPSVAATEEGQRLPFLEDAPALPETASQRQRRAEVLSMIRFPAEELGYEIAFLGPRAGYRAMTNADKLRIEVYMRPGESAQLQAYDLAHELGHAFDLVYNNAERRRRWRELRGIAISAPWFGCNGCPDYNSPAGDFAETFALLLLGPDNYHSKMAPPPTPKQIRELTAFCRTGEIGTDRRDPIALSARASNR